MLRTTQRVFRRGIGELSGLGAIDAKTQRSRPSAGYGDPLADVASADDMQVDSYSHSGFVVNGVSLRGAVLLLPRLSLMFSVPTLDELTPRSLEVLRLLDLRTDLLVIGCGRSMRPPPAPVRAWLTEYGISSELASTPHACSTFNFMVQENRPVAAVLFPLGSADVVVETR